MAFYLIESFTACCVYVAKRKIAGRAPNPLTSPLARPYPTDPVFPSLAGHILSRLPIVTVCLGRVLL